jgi:hypothetical protein
MAFFLLLATLQSPQGIQAIAQILITVGVFAFLGLVFWLASRR